MEKGLELNAVKEESCLERNLFDGSDLSVKAVLFASDELVITFTHLGDPSNPFVQGFGESFFRKNAISAVHFISKKNNWWQTYEMRDAIEAVKRSRVFSGKKKCIGYGSSMGAYAAIQNSDSLNLDTVIALTPQVSIDPSKTGPDLRWRAYSDNIDFINDNIIASASKRADIIVAFDRGHQQDSFHGREIIAELPNSRPVLLPFAAHPVTTFLLDAELLQDFVIGLARGTLGPREISVRRRFARRKSGIYWRWLADRLLRRSNWAGASAAAEEACRLLPKHPQAWKILAIAKYRLGQHAQARSAIEQSLTFAPENPEIRRLYEDYTRHQASRL